MVWMKAVWMALNSVDWTAWQKAVMRAEPKAFHWAAKMAENSVAMKVSCSAAQKVFCWVE
jgi:hypothetical protein